MNLYHLYPILALAVAALAIPSSHASWETGNGGDEAALEFVSLGNQIAKESRVFYQGILSEAETDRIREAALTTKVESTTSPLKIDGAVKDAINYPDKKLIRISRQRWQKMLKRESRLRIVFHEYLSIAGIDDSHYLISSKLYGPWANPVGQLYKKAGSLLFHIVSIMTSAASPSAPASQVCLEGGRLIEELEQTFDFWLDLEQEIPVDADVIMGESRPFLALTGLSDPLNLYCAGPDSPQARAKLRIRLEAKKQAMRLLLSALEEVSPQDNGMASPK